MLLQEMERRKYKTEEEKRSLIPELRGISREEYLKKREDQKLAEMKDALEDEERLFAVGPISYAYGGPCSSPAIARQGHVHIQSLQALL